MTPGAVALPLEIAEPIGDMWEAKVLVDGEVVFRKPAATEERARMLASEWATGYVESLITYNEFGDPIFADCGEGVE